MTLALALSLVGAVALVAGVSLAAFLLWGILAAASAGLVLVGVGCLYSGLMFDLTPKKG